MPVDNSRSQRQPSVQSSQTISLTVPEAKKQYSISILDSKLNKWKEDFQNEINDEINKFNVCKNAPCRDVLAEPIFAPKMFAGNLKSAPGLNTFVTSLCNVELFNNIDQERIRNNWPWKKTIKKTLKCIIPAVYMSALGDVSIAAIRGAIAEVLDQKLTQAGLCSATGICLISAGGGVIGGFLIMKILHLIYLMVKKGWKHFKEHDWKYFCSKRGCTDVQESFKELWPKDWIGWVKLVVELLVSIAITAFVPSIWNVFLITMAVGTAFYLIMNAIKLEFSGEYNDIWDFIRQTFWPTPGAPCWKLKTENLDAYDPHELGRVFEKLLNTMEGRSITLICPISNDLICNPVFSQCSAAHVFDQIYLQRHFNKQQNQNLPAFCPICREIVPFVEGEWKPVTKHKEIINEIAKLCEFKIFYQRGNAQEDNQEKKEEGIVQENSQEKK